MTDIDKPLKTSNNPRLYRAKRTLDSQKIAPTLATSIDEDSPKQLNITEGETGGPKGPDPTRYGDWERKGRCIDF